MRVAHYLRRIRLEDGGTVRAALDMCSALADAGHEVTLLSCDDTDAPEAWRRDGGPEPGLPVSRVLPAPNDAGASWSRGARIAVSDSLAGQDVLHVHALWIMTNIQIAARAKSLGVPYVVSTHGMLDDWSMGQKTLKKRVFLALAGRRFLEGARALHFTADSELKQSSAWFRRPRGFSIPLLFDPSPYRDLPGPEGARERFGLRADGPPVLLFLSRLHSGKRADLVIEASALLRERGVLHRLVVAGSGDEAERRALEGKARTLGLDDALFPGGVFGEDKVSLYQAASAFMLPSEHENFCFALVEAMVSGTPAVTVKTIAIWEELERSGGAVIASASAESLADAVTPLLTDREQAARMGAAGRERLRRWLDPVRVVSEYEEMYAFARGAGD